MTSEEQLELFDESASKLRNLLINKGEDYAQDGDILKNFIEVAKICEILGIDTKRPEGYCLLMIILKLHRISNLLFSGKEAKNESVVDSVDDLQGYSFLLKCLLITIYNKNRQNEYNKSEGRPQH